MHWFKWTYFLERALLFPQRCSQGHCAACSGDHVFATAGSRRSVPSAGRGIVNLCTVSTCELSRASLRETSVLSSSEFLKMSKHSSLESFDIELFINEIEQLLAIWVWLFLVLYKAGDEPSTGDISFQKFSFCNNEPLESEISSSKSIASTGWWDEQQQRKVVPHVGKEP